MSGRFHSIHCSMTCRRREVSSLTISEMKTTPFSLRLHRRCVRNYSGVHSEPLGPKRSRIETANRQAKRRRLSKRMTGEQKGYHETRKPIMMMKKVMMMIIRIIVMIMITFPYTIIYIFSTIRKSWCAGPL